MISHNANSDRYRSLDGWRGISILLVLIGHLLPVGLKQWQLNGSIAASGMAIFFILSGFLISTMLIKNQSIKNFIVRRFFRIVPLAWLGMLVAMLLQESSRDAYLPHLLFYANWPPILFIEGTSHFGVFVLRSSFM